MPAIILASASPRRRELLRLLGLKFTTVASRVNESRITGGSPRQLALKLAVAKAEAVALRYPQAVVIGADTIVAIGQQVFGKPASRTEAASMLRRLSGRRHQLITGYAIIGRQRVVADVVSTMVQFKHLAAKEISAYVRRAEPMDKAGAYAIQGLGAALVKKINGSYSSAIGLPLLEISQALRQFNIHVF